MKRLAATVAMVLAGWLTAASVVAQAPADFDRLAAYWNALASERAGEAQAAVDALAAEPAAALALIERDVVPQVTGIDARVRELVAELRSPQFDRRERAERELAALGSLAAPELRRQQAARLPLEARRRIEELLAAYTGDYAVTPQDRRLVRIVALLQRIDDPRAAALLAVLEPARRLAIVDLRVPPLAAQLESRDPAIQIAAALQLIRIGDAAAPLLPRIIDLMAGDGPPVALGGMTQRSGDFIASALPTLGRRAVEPLLAALTRDDAMLRTRAAMVLGVIRDERAVDPLVALLADADPNVSGAAAGSLGQLGPPAVEPLLKALADSVPPARFAIAGALIRTADERAIPPLARFLYADDAETRKWGVHALRSYGPRALDELIAAFQSDDPTLRGDGEVRQELIAAIMVLDDPRVGPLLLEAIRDPEPRVRGNALSFLLVRQPAALDDPQLVELVLAAVADPALEVRQGALNLLQSAGGRGVELDRERLAAAVLPALDDASPDLRLQAIYTIGEWRLAAAVDRLVKLLNVDDGQVQGAAAVALGRIGDARALPRLRELIATQDPRFIDALGNLRDRESVPVLIELLRTGLEPAQQASVRALGQMRDARAVEPLIARLAADPQHAHETAGALGELGDPRAIEPLIEVTRSWNGGFPALRGGPWPGGGEVEPSSHIATRPLEEFGPLALPSLTRALRDDNQITREVAAYVIEQASFPAETGDATFDAIIEPLALALADESPVVRQHVALALGRLGDKRAIPALVELIERGGGDDQHWYLGLNAAAALSKIKDPSAVPPLIELLAATRPDVRTCAARALGYLRDQRAVEPLLPLLADAVPAVRVEAAGSLGRLKAVAAVEPLIKSLADASAEVRAAAAEGLGRLAERPTEGDPPPADLVALVADALAARADDADFTIRVAAGLALERLDDERGVAILTRALADDNAKVRQDAATAISLSFLTGQRLVPLLIDGLDDPEIRVRLYAAGALGRIGGDAVVEALLAHTDDQENLYAIVQALGATHDERAFPAIIAQLNAESPTVRTQAIYAIADSAIPNRVALIAARLDDADREVRLAAIAALARLKSAEARPFLEALAEDPDPKIAAHAAYAARQLPSAP